MRFCIGLSILLLITACSPTASDKLSPEEVRVLNEARAAAHKGDVTQAEMHYQKAITLSEGSVEAHVELARLQRNKNKLDEAVATLNNAQKIQPKNGAVFKELGLIAIEKEDPVKAFEALSQAATYSPSDAQIYNAMGIVLDMQRKHKEAQEQYKKAMSMAPGDNAYIQNNLALSLIMTRDYPSAISILEPLAPSSNSNPTIRQNLALAYGLSGDFKKARAIGLRDLPESLVKQNIEFYKLYQKETQKSAK